MVGQLVLGLKDRKEYFGWQLASGLTIKQAH